MSNQGRICLYPGKLLIEQFLHLDVAQMRRAPSHNYPDQMDLTTRYRGDEIKAGPIRKTCLHAISARIGAY